MPTNIREADISPHAATLHWIVPHLVYTPEKYVVYYENSTMNLTSTESQSGANFSLNLNLSLSTRLTLLSPGTSYSYYINVTNTHGSTRTSKRSFKTLDSCMYTILDIDCELIFFSVQHRAL